MKIHPTIDKSLFRELIHNDVNIRIDNQRRKRDETQDRIAMETRSIYD